MPGGWCGMSDDPVPVALTPRRADALDAIIDAHLACEDEVAALEPPTPPRDRSADGAVVYQITCADALDATLEGRKPPMCAWVMEGHCPRCVVCDRLMRPDSRRTDDIARAIGLAIALK